MADDDDWDVAPAVVVPAAARRRRDEEEEVVEHVAPAAGDATKPKTHVDDPLKPKALSRQERDDILREQEELAATQLPKTAAEREAEAARKRKLEAERDEGEIAAQFANSGFVKAAPVASSAAGSGSGSASAGAPAAGAGAGAGAGDLGATLQRAPVSSPKDAEALAKAVAKRLETGVTNKNVTAFLKELSRQATANLTEEEVTEVLGVLNAVKADKAKAKALAKQRAQKAKPDLRKTSDRDDLNIELDIGRGEARGAGRRGFDDGDFMQSPPRVEGVSLGTLGRAA